MTHREGNRKQNSRSGRECRGQSRRQSSRQGRGRGSKCHLKRVWGSFVAHLPKRLSPAALCSSLHAAGSIRLAHTLADSMVTCHRVDNHNSDQLGQNLVEKEKKSLIPNYKSFAISRVCNGSTFCFL